MYKGSTFQGMAVASTGDDDRRGIDPNLRERVIEQIGIVTDALDSVKANPTDEALEQLRDAADKLMRALGRILIEATRQLG